MYVHTPYIILQSYVKAVLLRDSGQTLQLFDLSLVLVATTQ